MATETEPRRQNASLRLRDGGENTPLTSNSYEEETDPQLLGSGCCMKVKSKFRSWNSLLIMLLKSSTDS